jgi:glycosyltransferase involved in cell wall biosynthesis
LRILLVSGRYLPEKSAGIENYSHWLANVLIQNNHHVDVAILESKNMESYTYESVKVFPLKNGSQSFIQLIENNGYDICHFQEYSGKNGIYIQWFRFAKEYCEKVFFTFHLPYLTCYKNDFRYKGIIDCNNFCSGTRCVKCIIATKLDYKKSQGIELKNIGIDLITPILERTSKVKQLKERIEDRSIDLKELINICDQIFIYGAWFKEILAKNGFESSKIKLIPHITNTSENAREKREDAIKNKILFVGRIEYQKGLHLLCKAMNLIEIEGLQLDVAGNKVDEEYYNLCKSEYTFNYLAVLPRSQLLSSFHQYDFLILPSVFTEMYSLVLREAFYESLPVIASAAKGNVDVVKEGKNGFIFKYNDHQDLARVIDEAYALRQKGWQPGFEAASSSENGLQQILSYYKTDSIKYLK